MCLLTTNLLCINILPAEMNNITFASKQCYLKGFERNQGRTPTSAAILGKDGHLV